MLKLLHLWELVLGSLFVKIHYDVISRSWYISNVEVQKNYYYKLRSLNKHKFDGTLFSSALLISAESFWQFIYSRNTQLGWNLKDHYFYRSHILTVSKPVHTGTEYWSLPSTSKLPPFQVSLLNFICIFFIFHMRAAFSVYLSSPD